MVDVVAAAAMGAVAGALAWHRPVGATTMFPTAVGVLVVLGLWWSSAIVAVVGPLLVVVAMVEHRRRLRADAARRLSRQFPVAVDRLVQRLQSGHSLHTVVGELDTGPTEISTLLAPAARALRAGSTLERAVEALVGGDGDRRVELLAATLGTLAANGGPAVTALQRLRFTLIGFVQAEDEAAAHAGQALASAALLALAPCLFSILVAAVDADARRLYAREPIGAACVAGAVILSYGGWRWMSSAVSRAGGPGLGRDRR